MPTYAYACTTCEHRFETQQSFSDDTLTECPQCQGRLRKLFNSVGIVFKGSGFYRTDSRSNGAEKSGESSGKKAGESSGEKSGDRAGEKSGEKGSEKPAEKAASTSSGSSSSGSGGSSTSPAGSAA